MSEKGKKELELSSYHHFMPWAGLEPVDATGTSVEGRFSNLNWEEIRGEMLRHIQIGNSKVFTGM